MGRFGPLGRGPLKDVACLKDDRSGCRWVALSWRRRGSGRYPPCRSWWTIVTRCDLRRDPGACFAAFDAWQRQLQVVQPDLSPLSSLIPVSPAPFQRNRDLFLHAAGFHSF